MSPKAKKIAESKVTIKIPRPLYNHLSHIVSDSGFNSVTDFIVFVLRDLISNQTTTAAGPNNQTALSPQEIEAIRARLKSLGYF
ncbi:MAG TPA: CopG family transcriptional regulator [bacterium]|nr:CopG family transcriptional regulator [bacterium]HPN33799.1 CopG family transcriptional regulator [bacterium]